ncbi:MAG: pitrilysin family protein [Nitrospinae bacterium]|nr:pitrilysin family protein [Nitrospinota bacterium]
MRKTRNLRAILSAAGLFLLLAMPHPGADARTETVLRVPWNVTEHKMKNGMRALLLPDNSAPMVVMKVWYAVGSRDEQPGLTGIAHYLEHMMFRGTKKYGPRRFSEIIKKNGGSHNAFTGFDYTAYYERIASDRLELIIELEADRMVNLLLQKAAFDAEKNVVHEERRTRYDRPVGKFWEQLRAVAYTNHPYRNPIIGWPEDIDAITIKDMEAFYKRYYSPENAVAVLVGDFKVDEAIALLEKHFGKIPESPTFRKRPRLAEFPQKSERRVYVRVDAQLPYVALGYHAPNWKSEDAPALVMLEAILGGGETSRIYQRLVRKDTLALGAGADYTYISVDPMIFYLYARVAPGKKAADAEKALLEEVEKLIAKGVTDEEFRRALRNIEAKTVFAMDSHYFRARLLGTAAIAGDWRLLEGYLPALRKVTPAGVVRVARKYLSHKNKTTAELIPTKKSRRANTAKSRGGR